MLPGRSVELNVTAPAKRPELSDRIHGQYRVVPCNGLTAGIRHKTFRLA